MAKKKINISVEEKLKALYNLQCVDSEIDNIRIVRGELPIEIQDLEDELFRLESRASKFQSEIDRRHYKFERIDREVQKAT